MKRKMGLWILVFLVATVLAPAVLAMEDAPAAATAAAAAMTVAEAVAIAIAVVQFLKDKIIPGIWDKLGDTAKFAAAVLASAGVTLYKYLFLEHLTLNFAAVGFFVQVVIGATVGYSVLKGIAPILSRSSNKPA